MRTREQEEEWGQTTLSQPSLSCSAREMTEVVKHAGNRFCFLLSHPGKEDGKLPCSLSLVPKWEHGFLGGDGIA